LSAAPQEAWPDASKAFESACEWTRWLAQAAGWDGSPGEVWSQAESLADETFEQGRSSHFNLAETRLELLHANSIFGGSGATEMRQSLMEFGQQEELRLEEEACLQAVGAARATRDFLQRHGAPEALILEGQRRAVALFPEPSRSQAWSQVEALLLIHASGTASPAPRPRL
jgi:hypothetical protein